MTALAHPALQWFVTQIGDGLTLAQVFIRPAERGYELRHEADRSRAPEELRLLPLEQMRRIAQFTASGAFRPLKAAPDSIWRLLFTTQLATGVTPAGWLLAMVTESKVSAPLPKVM